MAQTNRRGERAGSFARLVTVPTLALGVQHTDKYFGFQTLNFFQKVKEISLQQTCT